MSKKLLLGDEAIAQAAIDAGISGVYAYPGTPSTEITEYIQHHPVSKQRNIYSRWCTNEKTAMEAALGMSFIGKRSIVCMKHVGLNVSADCFINAAITGVHGGLVIISADDPSMHSSQNEQDSRFYGDFALIPILEPSNQQEAYDMTYYGLQLSEQMEVPVLLRIVTRLAHSRSGVTVKKALSENKVSYSKDSKQFILLPGIARKRYQLLIEKQIHFEEESENSKFNRYIKGSNYDKGIVACGIAYNYIMEHFPHGSEYPIVKVGQYPLPKKQLKKLFTECKEIVVMEDGQPFVEKNLKGFLGLGVNVTGRLTNKLPRTGELNPDNVGKALGKEIPQLYTASKLVKMRPPALCEGCGHRDLFTALNEVVEEFQSAKVFSDIGCYTLGAGAPFHAIDSCVDMGASITMAKGAADGGQHPSIAVIGDSTFTHSGMTGLLDCVNTNSAVTIIISDNETTAMTGGQDSAGTGRIESICLGLGVEKEHLRVIVPLKKNHESMKEIIREEITYQGVSVIIPRRECIQTLKRKRKK